ncbi:amino acid permease C-terminal domain-containing protein [Streptomyces decoyicus]|uniref:amino acid permease C-terminal domain-containing protein n=1 Tax=Streptomyces decoyicus TaxID=249567 RepID=UPI003635DD88
MRPTDVLPGQPPVDRPGTLVSGFVAVLAVVCPLDVLADPTSLGILVAFVVVSVGVIILRRTAPGLDRGFKVPGYPVVPLLSVAFCGCLLAGLPLPTYLMFAGWLALAPAVYRGYSRHRSRLR